MSVRLKLTLSYAGFLMVAGALLLAVVWVFLLRYVPEHAVTVRRRDVPDGTIGPGGLFVPGRDDLWRAFAPKAAWAAVFLLGFGLVGGWLLAGRMLAPLTRITAATRLAATGSLSHRIGLEGPQDEFRELSDSFDGMLARLEAHVAEQRRFAANASHELRTPLAITKTLLEVSRLDPDRDLDELVARLETVNTRAIDLTEALLVLSRADQRAFAREPVDLSLAVEETADSLLGLAAARHVTLETAAEPAVTTGSPTLLLQLVSNLVHNAIVHNSDRAGHVWVTTSVEGGEALLRVENTGEPLDPGVVGAFTEPFQRGSERRRSDHGGVGLGLAIVRSIAAAHDGRLVLAARPGGGLQAVVRLPAAGVSGRAGG